MEGKDLSISRRFAEVAPAPILHLHRHQDGYVAFAVERDGGEDFRPLVSIRASELETWFPAFRDQLMKDAFVGINADWRLRSYGEHGAVYGFPLHRSDRLRYINACYVDVDFHKLGLDAGTVIGRVINLQDSGQLPYASMIVKSGQGLWLLWLIHDVDDADVSQRAFPDKLELYSRIQNAIIERMLPLGADMTARDAARHIRIPGSLHTQAEATVEWWIQGAGDSGYIYTLPELAKVFKAIPTKRHHGELIAHNPAKRRGWVALNARRLKDFNTLRVLRGGFSAGCRNNAAKIYGWLLCCNAIPKADRLALLTVMGEQCLPRLSTPEIKAAWRYTGIRRMRDQKIADWLKVTPAESEVLEHLPPAGLAPAPKPVRVSMAAIKGSIIARRAEIQANITETGNIPTVRSMAAILNSKGHSGNHEIVNRDYKALGIESDRTRKAKRSKALELARQNPSLLLYAPSRQDSAPANQRSGGEDGYEFWRDRMACEGLLA